MTPLWKAVVEDSGVGALVTGRGRCSVPLVHRGALSVPAPGWFGCLAFPCRPCRSWDWNKLSISSSVAVRWYDWSFCP